MAAPSKKEILDFSPMNRGEPEELPAYRRKAFGELKKALDTELIVAVTGLRRVGKTTLIKQLVGKEASYFSFDEKRYANPESLKKVIEVFVGEREKPLIVLDEIFRVEDWAGAIKNYHDQKLARFIVSGSSALLVKKGIESLSGRLFEHYLPPLSFHEYLELGGKKPEAITSVREAFKARKRFVEEAQEFLKKGSFPEIIGMDYPTAREYIRTSTVEKIVFDDIPTSFRIEHPSKLYDLLRLCATNSARLFTEVNYAEALQLSRHAVADYLLYLQKAFLVQVIYPAGSMQKALKKQKKIFANTAALYSALAEDANAGQAAETAVFDKLSQSKLFFYRDAQKREVDFVAETPVEVKYQNSVTTADAGNLLYFMQKKRVGEAIVVTKDFFDEKTIDGKKIYFIPLDVFLLTKFGKGGTA